MIFSMVVTMPNRTPQTAKSQGPAGTCEIPVFEWGPGSRARVVGHIVNQSEYVPVLKKAA